MAFDADPRIVYDSPDLTDPSFEANADGSIIFPDFPNRFLGGSDLIEYDDAQFFQRGANDAGGQSAYFKKVTASGASGVGLGNHHLEKDGKIWLPPADQKIGFLAVGRASQAGAMFGLRLVVRNSAWGTLSLQPGWHTFAQANTWEVMTNVFDRTDNADSYQIEAVMVPYTGGGVEYWIDQIQIGRVLDFDNRGIQRYRPEDIGRFASDHGYGSFQSVEIAKPYSRVQARFGRIGEAVDLDAEIRDFHKYALTGEPFSFWADRSASSNAEHHYRDCVLRGRVRYQYQPGYPAYVYEIDFDAPLEFRA